MFHCSLCFLHDLMKMLPSTVSVVFAVHKSKYHRIHVYLLSWPKSMIVHYEASVHGFVVRGR